MAKRPPYRPVTSERAARAASKVLRNPLNSKAYKVARGIALTQRPRADLWDWYDDPNPQQTGITLHEDDEPEYTGLLDADGNELVRVRNRIPMGFRE